MIAKRLNVDVVVLDGSCSGGASPFLAESGAVKQCAIATTPPGAPAVQGTPPLSQFLALSKYPFIKTFADLAQAGGLSVLAQMPDRAQQSVFYTSDGSAISSMTLRASFYGVDQSLGAWDLGDTDIYRYLHDFVVRRYGEDLLHYLGGDTVHPASVALDRRLKRAANLNNVLDRVLQVTRDRWQITVAARGRSSVVPEAEQRAFNELRTREFATAPLRMATSSGSGTLIENGGDYHLPLLKAGAIPPTVLATRGRVLELIGQIRRNQQPLADALSALDRDIRVRGNTPARPSPAAQADLETIVRLLRANRDVLPTISRLLGLLEYADMRSKPSSCNASID